MEVEVALGEAVKRPHGAREGARLRVGFDGSGPGTVTWNAIADVLADDRDDLAREFAEFVRRDVLGLEAVGLDDALHTNRLYALGGAALRERFGEPRSLRKQFVDTRAGALPLPGHDIRAGKVGSCTTGSGW